MALDSLIYLLLATRMGRRLGYVNSWTGSDCLFSAIAGAPLRQKKKNLLDYDFIFLCFVLLIKVLSVLSCYLMFKNLKKTSRWVKPQYNEPFSGIFKVFWSKTKYVIKIGWIIQNCKAPHAQKAWDDCDAQTSASQWTLLSNWHLFHNFDKKKSLTEW